MSIAGKKSVHFIKKDIASQKTPAIAFKSLRFAHKATLGQTVINLASLTLPTEENYASFVNPSLSELNGAQLLFNQKNLVLVSSLSGVLNSGSYKVTGNLSIELVDTAEDGEIFEGVIMSAPRTGVQMVDALPVVSTGTLAANDDEFVVGNVFQVNKYPSQQQGEVLVFLDGQLMKRNVGNATAAPSADGNYEEVDSGGGVGNTIKFNITDPSAREVTVVSNGLAFAAPNDSLMAVVESLAGQVDAMIPTLADLAGVPEGDFQAAPNNVDLKTFGDRVKGLEEPGSPGDPLLATTTIAGAVKKPDSQIRVDSGNGHGATNTKFRRFTNVTSTLGAGVTYADSATLGGSFTINEAGIYAMTYNDVYTAGETFIGISLNGVGTTNIEDQTALARLAFVRGRTAEENSSCSATIRLNPGDVIRAHTNGNPNEGSGRCQFIITQVVKL